MKKLILCVILMTIFNHLFAQTEYKHINSDSIISEGIEAYENGEYQKSYDLYELVHPGDTNYMRVSYEKSLALLSLKRYDSTITLCRELLKKPYAAHNLTYNNLGTALDEKGEPDKAIAAYLEGLSFYPMSDDLHFNLAITYQKNDQIDSAVFHYKEVLKLNMFHASANVRLGFICANENQMAKAMMCLNVFLIVEPNSNRSLNVLEYYNDILSSNFSGEPLGILTSKAGEDNFEDVDLIIKNRLALNTKYETPNKLDYAVVKQNYALLEAIGKKSGEGFWTNSYVPFFQSLYKNDHFNGYIYYILQSSKNEKIQKLISQKTKEINDFANWAGPELIKDFSEFKVDLNGKDQLLTFTHKGSRLESVGTYKNGEMEGPWSYYYNSGSLGAYGNYAANEKDGNWRYYFSNGQLSSDEISANGKLNGVDKGYYFSGVLSNEDNYEKGILKGPSKSYYASSGLNSLTNYSNNKKEGEAYYYYEVGPVNFHVYYKENELDGPFTEFYASGSIASETNYKAGKREGLIKTYFESGELKTEVNYKNGLEEGPYKIYYKNGTKKEDGEYREGVLIKVYKEYYSDGTVKSEGEYDEDGKQNGIYREYTRDGKLSIEYDYNKGEIVGYRSYDSEGKILSEKRKKDKRFLFVSYYPDGIKKAEGLYEVGDIGKVGTWKFYYSNGMINQEETFTDGQLNGELIQYFKNGNISGTSTYKDGMLNGLSTEYRIDGSIISQRWFENDLENGSNFNYYPDESVNSHLFYVNDKKNGPQLYYDINGKINSIDYYEFGIFKKHQDFDLDSVIVNEFEVVFDSTEYILKNDQNNVVLKYVLKNNIFHGPVTHYYGNGVINSKGYNFNNRRFGEYIWYHPNGEISVKGDYFNGDQQGIFESFDESGNLIKKRNYQDDKLVGKYFRYYPDGTLEYEADYIDGEIHGPSYYYSPGGFLRHIRYYRYGTIIGYSYAGKDGQPVEMIPLKNESGKVVSYFENGNKSVTFEFINGLFEGEYHAYYENGQLYEHINFKDDSYNGDFEEYYPNGNLKTITPYKNDDIHGVKKYFREDGTLELEETYKFDKLHGETRRFDTKGKLVKTEEYYNNFLRE